MWRWEGYKYRLSPPPNPTTPDAQRISRQTRCEIQRLNFIQFARVANTSVDDPDIIKAWHAEMLKEVIEKIMMRSAIHVFEYNVYRLDYEVATWSELSVAVMFGCWKEIHDKHKKELAEEKQSKRYQKFLKTLSIEERKHTMEFVSYNGIQSILPYGDDFSSSDDESNDDSEGEFDDAIHSINKCNQQ
ncbi:MAG: hypothetical protein HOI55_14115 [Candidatus Marinimicrobia bacterium]|nr:hypothetical protein [Candidatus Neomarinimicrobiota bacterium]